MKFSQLYTRDLKATGENVFYPEADNYQRLKTDTIPGISENVSQGAKPEEVQQGKPISGVIGKYKNPMLQATGINGDSVAVFLTFKDPSKNNADEDFIFLKAENTNDFAQSEEAIKNVLTKYTKPLVRGFIMANGLTAIGDTYKDLLQNYLEKDVDENSEIIVWWAGEPVVWVTTATIGNASSTSFGHPLPAQLKGKTKPVSTATAKPDAKPSITISTAPPLMHREGVTVFDLNTTHLQGLSISEIAECKIKPDIENLDRVNQDKLPTLPDDLSASTYFREVKTKTSDSGILNSIPNVDNLFVRVTGDSAAIFILITRSNPNFKENDIKSYFLCKTEDSGDLIYGDLMGAATPLAENIEKWLTPFLEYKFEAKCFIMLSDNCKKEEEEKYLDRLTRHFESRFGGKTIIMKWIAKEDSKVGVTVANKMVGGKPLPAGTFGLCEPLKIRPSVAEPKNKPSYNTSNEQQDRDPVVPPGGEHKQFNRADFEEPIVIGDHKDPLLKPDDSHQDVDPLTIKQPPAIRRDEVVKENFEFIELDTTTAERKNGDNPPPEKKVPVSVENYVGIEGEIPFVTDDHDDFNQITSPEISKVPKDRDHSKGDDSKGKERDVKQPDLFVTGITGNAAAVFLSFSDSDPSDTYTFFRANGVNDLRQILTKSEHLKSLFNKKTVVQGFFMVTNPAIARAYKLALNTILESVSHESRIIQWIALSPDAAVIVNDSEHASYSSFGHRTSTYNVSLVKPPVAVKKFVGNLPFRVDYLDTRHSEHIANFNSLENNEKCQLFVENYEKPEGNRIPFISKNTRGLTFKEVQRGVPEGLIGDPKNGELALVGNAQNNPLESLPAFHVMDITGSVAFIFLLFTNELSRNKRYFAYKARNVDDLKSCADLYLKRYLKENFIVQGFFMVSDTIQDEQPAIAAEYLEALGSILKLNAPTSRITQWISARRDIIVTAEKEGEGGFNIMYGLCEPNLDAQKPSENFVFFNSVAAEKDIQTGVHYQTCQPCVESFETPKKDLVPIIRLPEGTVPTELKVPIVGPLSPDPAKEGNNVPSCFIIKNVTGDDAAIFLLFTNKKTGSKSYFFAKVEGIQGTHGLIDEMNRADLKIFCQENILIQGFCMTAGTNPKSDDNYRDALSAVFELSPVLGKKPDRAVKDATVKTEPRVNIVFWTSLSDEVLVTLHSFPDLPRTSYGHLPFEQQLAAPPKQGELQFFDLDTPSIEAREGECSPYLTHFKMPDRGCLPMIPDNVKQKSKFTRAQFHTYGKIDNGLANLWADCIGGTSAIIFLVFTRTDQSYKSFLFYKAKDVNEMVDCLNSDLRHATKAELKGIFWNDHVLVQGLLVVSGDDVTSDQKYQDALNNFFGWRLLDGSTLVKWTLKAGTVGMMVTACDDVPATTFGYYLPKVAATVPIIPLDTRKVEEAHKTAQEIHESRCYFTPSLLDMTTQGGEQPVLLQNVVNSATFKKVIDKACGEFSVNQRDYPNLYATDVKGQSAAIFLMFVSPYLIDPTIRDGFIDKNSTDQVDAGHLYYKTTEADRQDPWYYDFTGYMPYHFYKTTSVDDLYRYYETELKDYCRPGVVVKGFYMVSDPQVARMYGRALANMFKNNSFATSAPAIESSTLDAVKRVVKRAVVPNNGWISSLGGFMNMGYGGRGEHTLEPAPNFGGDIHVGSVWWRMWWRLCFYVLLSPLWLSGAAVVALSDKIYKMRVKPDAKNDPEPVGYVYDTDSEESQTDSDADETLHFKNGPTITPVDKSILEPAHDARRGPAGKLPGKPVGNLHPDTDSEEERQIMAELEQLAEAKNEDKWQEQSEIVAWISNAENVGVVTEPGNVARTSWGNYMVVVDHINSELDLKASDAEHIQISHGSGERSENDGQEKLEIVEIDTRRDEDPLVNQNCAIISTKFDQLKDQFVCSPNLDAFKAPEQGQIPFVPYVAVQLNKNNRAVNDLGPKLKNLYVDNVIGKNAAIFIFLYDVRKKNVCKTFVYKTASPDDLALDNSKNLSPLGKSIQTDLHNFRNTNFRMEGFLMVSGGRNIKTVVKQADDVMQSYKTAVSEIFGSNAAGSIMVLWKATIRNAAITFNKKIIGHYWQPFAATHVDVQADEQLVPGEEGYQEIKPFRQSVEIVDINTTAAVKEGDGWSPTVLDGMGQVGVNLKSRADTVPLLPRHLVPYHTMNWWKKPEIDQDNPVTIPKGYEDYMNSFTEKFLPLSTVPDLSIAEFQNFREVKAGDGWIKGTFAVNGGIKGLSYPGLYTTQVIGDSAVIYIVIWNSDNKGYFLFCHTESLKDMDTCRKLVMSFVEGGAIVRAAIMVNGNLDMHKEYSDALEDILKQEIEKFGDDVEPSVDVADKKWRIWAWVTKEDPVGPSFAIDIASGCFGECPKDFFDPLPKQLARTQGLLPHRDLQPVKPVAGNDQHEEPSHDTQSGNPAKGGLPELPKTLIDSSDNDSPEAHHLNKLAQGKPVVGNVSGNKAESGSKPQGGNQGKKVPSAPGKSLLPSVLKKMLNVKQTNQDDQQIELGNLKKKVSSQDDGIESSVEDYSSSDENLPLTPRKDEKSAPGKSIPPLKGIPTKSGADVEPDSDSSGADEKTPLNSPRGGGNTGKKK